MFMLCFCYFYSFLTELDSATLTALDIDLDMESAPEAVGAQAQTEGDPTGPAEVQTEGETCSESSPILPVFGPMTLDETIEDMKCRIKPAIGGLAVPELLKLNILAVDKLSQLRFLYDKISVNIRVLKHWESSPSSTVVCSFQSLWPNFRTKYEYKWQ